jgi:predicted nuclease of predicted toxin-antitoxin system
VRIKLDENLPDRLVAVLTTLGHDVDTVHGEQLTGRADPDVWSAAQSARRFLITQDLDFSDFRRYKPGTQRVFCSFACRDQVGMHYLTA